MLSPNCCHAGEMLKVRGLCVFLAGQESYFVLQHRSNPDHVPAWRHQWGHQCHALAYTGDVLPESSLFTSEWGKWTEREKTHIHLASRVEQIVVKITVKFLVLVWLLICFNLVPFRTAFCTSVDFRFLLRRYSGVHLTPRPKHAPQCLMGGECG